MINEKQLREEIIRPGLDLLNLNSKAAEELLVLTACVETDAGSYVKQIQGPGLGLFSIEPATHDDIWKRYLQTRLREVYKILEAINMTTQPQAYMLKYNLLYSVLMARVFYLRFREPLPEHDDIIGLAEYWKKYFNTKLGRGTVDMAISKYCKYTKKKIPGEEKPTIKGKRK